MRYRNILIVSLIMLIYFSRGANSMIIPYDPNTMNYPVSVQQAEQAARDWAQNPTLDLVLEGIYLNPPDPEFPHYYALKSADALQKFKIHCQTGEMCMWVDVAASHAYTTKLNEDWPESTQMSAADLHVITRQFLSIKYQNFVSLNMQQLDPLDPQASYRQRFANGVWYWGNQGACFIDPWAGTVYRYAGTHSPPPTVSIDPTITQGEAEQAALSHCENMQIEDPDNHTLVYPQSAFILDNIGLWIAEDEQDEQRLAWRIKVTVSAYPGYTLEIYEQGVEETGDPDGPIYEVFVDAHTGEVFKVMEGGDIAKFDALPAPAVNPDSGDYQDVQNVTISSVSYGATIRYTTDGTDPTESSAVYTNPITVDHSLTLKAKTWKTNWIPSSVVTATYELQLPTPAFNPDGDTYQETQDVTISCAVANASIMYTLDNSEPTEQSFAYTGPVIIDHSFTLKAKAFKTNWTASDTKSGDYELELPTPAFNPDGGTYQGTQNVTMSCSISGATIRYTTDGNDPTESSAVYTGPVAISQSCTLKAKAFKSGWTESDIKSAAYTIE